MICYRDSTFCDFFEKCKKGNECPRALNKEVLDGAFAWWGKPGAPICKYVDRPKCFENKAEGTVFNESDTLTVASAT